jgi:glycine cleavage system H lipoate-binding protein
MNGSFRVGLDDIARRIVGRIDSVVPGNRGRHGRPGKACAVLKIRGGSVPLAFPFPGTLTAVNPILRNDPGAPFRDPYKRGWLFDLKPDAPPEQIHRLRGRDAERWFADEVRALRTAVAGGTASPESGEDRSWLDERLDARSRRRIARRFLFPRNPAPV